MECVDQDALITVRNGILDELSNNLPVVIKYSVLADVQVNMPISLIITLVYLLILVYLFIFLETTLFIRRIVNKRPT